jgi:iron(III) transport system ATP-binding protein
MSGVSLAVHALAKRYGPTSVFRDVSLDAGAGESVVIGGPSGCGKSTLLRLIAGLEYPDAGEVLLNGTLVSRPDWALEPHRRGIGYVFQSPALWPHMTVAQNVLFGLRRWSASAAHERLEELLAAVEISHLAQRYPDELSGGEARRVSLIRSLAPRPALLLLDEPLTSLDVELKERLLAFVKASVAETGATLLYVSHDSDEGEAFSEQPYSLTANGLRRIDDVPRNLRPAHSDVMDRSTASEALASAQPRRGRGQPS